MTRLLRTAAALAALPLALTACSATGTPAATPSASAPATLTVQHAQGTTEVPANPAKVVVLDFATLDTLDELDLESRVVAVPQLSALPETLSTYKDTATVGTAQEPDVEKIAALDPDLIVIGGRTAAKYAELAKVAPTLDLSTKNDQPIESLTQATQTLGDIFDARAKVDAELAELNSAIAEAKKAVPADAKGLILLTSGGKLSAYGPGGRFGSLIHDVLGVPAAATDLESSQHGQAVSFEFVAEKNPTHLFVVDRDAAIGQNGSPAKQVLDNPLVARTTAWTSDQVAYLDGGEWYIVGNGLGNIGEMIADVKDAVS